MTDPISDFFIRIKNAYAAKKERVLVPFSNLKFKIASELERGGFVQEVGKKKKKVLKSNHLYLDIKLKYKDNGPAMEGLRIFSSPSRRIYIKSKDIRPVRSGYGMAILSTPKGIMSEKTARKENVGGELIAEIW